MPDNLNLTQLYLDLTDDMLVAINREELVTDINKKGCDILGYPKAEIVRKNWFTSFVPAELREDIRSRFHQMLEGTIALEHYENPVVNRDGARRIISWHNILLRDEAGNVTGTLSAGEDITENRQIHQQLVESERRLRSTLNNMLEGFQVINFDWTYTYLNDVAAEQGRRHKHDLLGHKIMEVYPESMNPRLFAVLQDCLKNRVSHHLDNEFVFPDGSKGWFELRIEPVPEGILILSLDITQRKKLEEELEQYRQRLEVIVAERTADFSQTNEKLKQEIAGHQKTEAGLVLRAAILDNAPDAIFLSNLQGDFIYANQTAPKNYGYTIDELLNMNLRQLLNPQDALLVESRLKEIIEKKNLELETTHVRKDQSLLAVRVYHTLIQTQHGEFIVSVVREIPD